LPSGSAQKKRRAARQELRVGGGLELPLQRSDAIRVERLPASLSICCAMLASRSQRISISSREIYAAVLHGEQRTVADLLVHTLELAVIGEIEFADAHGVARAAEILE
jgi:hypothetical protein